MKLKRTINNNEGIYEIECKNHDEALALLKLVKEEYPYAIIEATGYYSKIYILNIFVQWLQGILGRWRTDYTTT